MTLDVPRLLLGLAALLASLGFLRLAFLGGKMVAGQETLAAQAAKAAAEFSGYAQKVDAILERHDREILTMKIREELKTEARAGRRPQPDDVPRRKD